MNKFDVTMALGRVHEARSKWNSAKRDFDEAVDKVMAVLLHEAARALMTQQEVAAASGLPVKRVRDLMRKHGLNPRDGKQMLSRQAAKALNENADLLGIKPQEMDLTSPLAYLPMGDEMRRQLADAQVKRVQEFPETNPLAAIQKAVDELLYSGRCLIRVRGELFEIRASAAEDGEYLTLDSLRLLTQAEA
jgi:hypothetical protein